MPDELHFCEAVVYRGNHINPTELCETEAEPGLDYCINHLAHDPDFWEEPDRDEEYL